MGVGGVSLDLYALDASVSEGTQRRCDGGLQQADAERLVAVHRFGDDEGSAVPDLGADEAEGHNRAIGVAAHVGEGVVDPAAVVVPHAREGVGSDDSEWLVCPGEVGGPGRLDLLGRHVDYWRRLIPLGQSLSIGPVSAGGAGGVDGWRGAV